MSLDYRTWGETRNCKGCRYWSERVAQAIGARGLEAWCLGPTSPFRGHYTVAHQTCNAWEEGSLGAVDDPGGNPYLPQEPKL